MGRVRATEDMRPLKKDGLEKIMMGLTDSVVIRLTRQRLGLRQNRSVLNLGISAA